jgi:translation initiation factor 3 subunit G
VSALCSFNDQGQKVKIVKKVRNKREKKSKKVMERRQWAKFGDAKGLGAEQEHRTMVSTEEIWIERRGLHGQKEDDKKAADPLAQLSQAGNTSLMVCRVCGKKGDHWSAQCPYKDLAANSGGDFSGSKPPEDGDRPGSSQGKSTSGAYVPPSRRAGAEGREGIEMGGGRGGRGRDDNSIRVTNLSEDTREEDLQELFRPFGPISRIYVAFDRETKQSRGFAFINFVNR